MKKLTKRYIVWIRNSGENYCPYEFDTLPEALLADKMMTDWYLTENLNNVWAASAKYEEPTKIVKD